MRGSTPAPGADFARYGGHTSCVAVSLGDAVPALALDAGTGIRRLTPLLRGEAFRGTILLSHLHWDHTHGLPFFSGGDNPAAQVSLVIPAQGASAEEVLTRAMSPPHFPIHLSELQGSWTFSSLQTGSHEIEAVSVLALEIPHKGGRTFGYRLDDGHSTLAYLSDHSPLSLGGGPDGLGEYHQAARALADDVDLLIHDAQYTSDELLTTRRRYFGHSAIDYAVGLGRECGARRVLLFHHDPARFDRELDAIVRRLEGCSPPVDAAVEGAVYDLSAPVPLEDGGEHLPR